ncbi:auxin-responsive protein SAUR71-like [Momordica charantia]|uniref:Auxin-responsive protein SAUR71-like n=1 Tax=Momordica charantia TaxID=3673 RepID=A0A6J1D5E1_MOMCH|nr:auxin-responsive protein SAUR71-like [Momordica charantia]
MDVKAKNKGLILKTWERCKSIGRGRRSSASGGIKRFLTRKTKSWPRLEAEEAAEEKRRRRRVAPEGCFTVYVGAERQRFVVKTESANHPLFRMLLEEAEAEYGFNSQAPLWLPCHVDSFYRVLTEMDAADLRRGYPKRLGSYHQLSPPSSLALNHFQF